MCVFYTRDINSIFIFFILNKIQYGPGRENKVADALSRQAFFTII